MKKTVLLVVTVFLFLGILFFARGKKSLIGSFDDYLSPSQSTAGGSPRSLGIQVSDAAGVLVEAELYSFSSAGINFGITLTSHTGSLDFDLAQNALLKIDSGEELRAVSWNGGRGGHHLTGTLSFPSPQTAVKSLKLVLSNVSNGESGAGSERVLEWDF